MGLEGNIGSGNGNSISKDEIVEVILTVASSEKRHFQTGKKVWVPVGVRVTRYPAYVELARLAVDRGTITDPRITPNVLSYFDQGYRSIKDGGIAFSDIPLG